MPAKSVVIKTASPDATDLFSRRCLSREYKAYQVSSIATSPMIRSMYDTIGDIGELKNEETSNPPCLVLEWLDCTLDDVPREMRIKSMQLLEALVTTGISSLATLDKAKLVHCDIKPANFLVSDLNSSKPTVKLGDLGLVQFQGLEGDTQPWAMRAPEIYRGKATFPSSEIWAFGAMLLVWMKAGILGSYGNKYGLLNHGWSVAKLMKLFPNWKCPPPDHRAYRGIFELAEMLIVKPNPEHPEEPLVKVKPLEEEMHSIGMDPVMMDLLRYLLNVDPRPRPSAAEALESKHYRALQEAAAAARLIATELAEGTGIDTATIYSVDR